MNTPKIKVSVVTPTYFRPVETIGLLENLAKQEVLPFEVILVDGAPSAERRTEIAVKRAANDFPFFIRYVRRGGGTAIQRNAGIDLAAGDFVALVDDDVRLERFFLQKIIEVFSRRESEKVGGIVGYRTNEHFGLEDSQRWRWYKRLKLLTVFEPGRYDFNCGYPINSSLQPPFTGTRQIDFMTTACAVWRREVFDGGLRFDAFFKDYGVLEDTHFSLRAGRDWTLLQHGEAHCTELRSPLGRVSRRHIGYKCVVNYYFVFQDIARPLSLAHKFRFWRYQGFEFFRVGTSALRRRRWSDLQEIAGRIEGIFAVMGGVTRSKN